MWANAKIVDGVVQKSGANVDIVQNVKQKLRLKRKKKEWVVQKRGANEKNGHNVRHI
jgi:hypothetical protein